MANLDGKALALQRSFQVVFGEYVSMRHATGNLLKAATSSGNANRLVRYASLRARRRV